MKEHTGHVAGVAGTGVGIGRPGLESTPLDPGPYSP